MRPATEADVPAIRRFLEARVERAMFPLANLAAHGLGRDHPFAMSFWIAEAEGRITGLLGQTGHGILLPALPEPVALREVEPSGITGIVGPAEEARAVERALGLTAAPRTLDHDEAHLALDLSDLAVPEGPGELRPIGEAPEPLIRAWMADYHRGTLSTPEPLVEPNVERWFEKAVAEDTHRVLVAGGAPLAMTGLNARLPRMVQIGGVYTPPGLRGRGHARRAVALDLERARREGVTAATLFASSEAAQRAYQAIGFRRIGTWTLLLFDGPQHV